MGVSRKQFPAVTKQSWGFRSSNFARMTRTPGRPSKRSRVLSPLATSFSLRNRRLQEFPGGNSGFLGASILDQTLEAAAGHHTLNCLLQVPKLDWLGEVLGESR